MVSVGQSNATLHRLVAPCGADRALSKGDMSLATIGDNAGQQSVAKEQDDVRGTKVKADE